MPPHSMWQPTASGCGRDLAADSDALPSLNVLTAALRKTTERLARELGCAMDRPPEWNDLEWRIARAAAAMQGVSALLADRLRWEGPPGWQQFLQEQKRQTIGRHRHIAWLLAEFDARARHEGIAIVALKGAALHALGLYTAGERPMADIDVLVRPDDEDATSRLIESLGWSAAGASWRHTIFEPVARPTPHGFGEQAGSPIKIELHTKVAARLPAFETDITDICFAREPRAGLNYYPSTASLMTHLLLHAAHNMCSRTLRLVQLHDIALLATRMSSGDWDELGGGARKRGLWWALPPLLVTARYFPYAIPRAVLAAIMPDCPWWLRRLYQRRELTDVSWSRLRFQAVPGIEWSRSPREAAAFVVRRLRPEPETRAVIAKLALQPSGSAVPWYGLSQPARILRWMFLRPARAQTMYSVQAALRQES